LGTDYNWTKNRRGKKRALEIFKFDERSSDRKKKEKIKD
jgi:hypothetical protein